MAAQYWRELEENIYSTPIRQGSLKLICFTSTYVLHFIPEESAEKTIHGGMIFYDPLMKKIVSASANEVFLENSDRVKEALGLPEKAKEGLTGILESIEADARGNLLSQK